MTTPPALGRRELNKLDRRQAIVDAARASFLANGYAGTSMSGLLKTLGGSKATLWGYFRSKEELFAAVVEEVSAAFRADFANPEMLAGDVEAALTAFCTAFLRALESPDAIATWRLVVGESGRSPEVGRIFYERAAHFTEDLLRAFFRRHIEAGHLRPGDPDRMASVLTSLCIGRQNRRLWGVAPTGSPDVEGHAAEFARIFMAAYAVPGA